MSMGLCSCVDKSLGPLPCNVGLGDMTVYSQDWATAAADHRCTRSADRLGVRSKADAPGKSEFRTTEPCSRESRASRSCRSWRESQRAGTRGLAVALTRTPRSGKLRRDRGVVLEGWALVDRICFPGRCESVHGRCGKNIPVFHAPKHVWRSVPRGTRCLREQHWVA